jgi:Putative Actinobacterial Holin-X, holin superfamily III
VSATPPGRHGTDQPHNVAAAIAEVSERASQLVREEIELAKAEVGEKATKLIKGAVVGIAAGVFFMTALVFALVGCAWLLYYFLPGGDFTFFWGFFAMAVILVVLGVLAGLVAARAVKKGSPPVPSLAFEEARKIRETVSTPGAGKAPDGSFTPGAAFAPAAAADSAQVAADSPPSPVGGGTPLADEAAVVAEDEGVPVAQADVVQGSDLAPDVESGAEDEQIVEAAVVHESIDATVVHESVSAPDADASAQSATVEGADPSPQTPTDEHDTSSSTPEDEH